MKLAPVLVLAAALLAALAWWRLSDAPHGAVMDGRERAAANAAARELASVAARDGESSPARAPESQDTRAVVDPDAEVVVHVVDETGAALAGFPVTCLTAGGTRFEAISDGAGRITVARERLGDHGVFVPSGVFDRGLELDLDTAEQPARLVVPPFGTLEVRVVGAGGESIDAECAFAPRWADDFAYSTPLLDLDGWPRVITAGGRARVERVQAHLDGVASALAHGETVTQSFTGPAAGGVATLTLRFDDQAVVLVGRVEGATKESRGWSWSILDIESRDGVHVGGARVRFAADGSFRIRVAPEAAAKLGAHAWIAFASDGALAAMHPLAGRLVAGVHDLGELRGPGEHLLVAGHAAYQGGSPYADELLYASVRAPGVPRPAQLWIAGRPRTDAEGRFELRGRGDGRLEWSLGPGNELLAAPATFVPGEPDLAVIVRSPAREIRGRLLLDDSGRPQRFHEHLALWVQRMGDTLTGKPATIREDGTFTVNDPPVPCRITVRALWHGRPIVQLDDVRHDPLREPLEIDLRGRLALAELRAVDANGLPLRFAVREVGPRDGQPTPVASLVAMTLLLDRAPQDLIASSPGRRDVLLLGVDGDRVVRFERAAIPVRLAWRAMPELADGARLCPLLVAEERLEENWHLHVDPRARASFDATGHAEAGAPAPGDYAVLLQAEMPAPDGRRWKQVLGGDAPRITVRDADDQPPFDVAWDEAAVHALVAKLAEAAKR